MDALVIGAGHAGLATSQCLRQQGVEHLVLERDTIGASWLNQRWESFALNTPNWLNRLPGDEDADVTHGEPGDGFMRAGTLVDRLRAYAARWDLPVREGVTVADVHRAEAGGYRVTVEGALDQPIGVDAIVVASGGQNVPRFPPLADAFPEHVRRLSALDYRAPDQLAPGAVLVVGGGQSGGQIVEDLLAAGREVYWSVSQVARIPRRYRGREIMEWLAGSGFFEHTEHDIPDPLERAATLPIISGVGRHGHSLSIQWLAGKGARLLGRIVDIRGPVVQLDDSVAACVRFADEASAEVHHKIDAGIRAAGRELPPNEPDPADDPAPATGAFKSPDVLDLESAGVRTVICATGVGGDFRYLPDEALREDGSPAQHHGRSAAPGIFHVSMPWQSCRGSAIIRGVARDASQTAGAVKSYLAASA